MFNRSFRPSFFFSFLLFSFVTLILGGCDVNNIQDYKDNTPALRMEDYFAGEVKGYGLVQKASGAVRRRFVVDMQGQWKGNKGTLDEHFVFDDGEKQERRWHLTKIDEHHFTGTAHDVIGVAQGEQYGNVIHMIYVLRVPYNNKTIDLDMDDWLYRVNEHVVLNNAGMKKFGFSVGKLTASFVKE
jgi:hypothetical protein